MDANINEQPTESQAPEDFISGTPVAGPAPEHRQTWTPPTPTQLHSAPRPKRVGVFPGLLIVATLLLSMVFGGVGAEVALLTASHSTAAVATTAATTTTTAATTTYGQAVAQIAPETIHSVYQKVSPSVVMITSLIRSTGRFQASGEATGSGIIVDAQGDILTNYHVINGATSIKVELLDGTQFAATVVGSAQQDDLALIKIDAGSTKLTPATLGSSSSVGVGDAVIAIGYPFGLDQSVTSGIVSGLNRDAGGTTSRTLSGLIQVDAAINPGNSGGPLLNADGEVIGVNTMIESPIEAFTGIGLAIPIDHIKTLLPQIEQGATVQRSWLGISGTEITSDMQAQYNLPVSKGILVADVVANGPAAVAGLQGSTVNSQDSTQLDKVGDIITAVDGQAVGTVAELTTYLNNKQPGEKVTLTIVRNGQPQSISVTLQAWPASTSSTGN